MVDVTIDQLTDGENIQTRAAITEIEQDGASFKTTTRPNAPDQINVRNQAQLEAELGTDLEIADNVRVTIVLDAAFTLTKPFKLGVNAALELYASTNNAALTYTGVGALFQGINFGDAVSDINLHNLSITGNGTNSVFDITGTTIVEVRNVIFSTFDVMGTTTDIPNIIFELTAFVNFTSQGLTMINPSNVSITTCSFVQFAPTGLTAFTIKTNIVTSVKLDFVRALLFFAGDLLVFFDPNSPTGSTYIIEKSSVVAGELYQLGGDIPVDTVFEILGITIFGTPGPHGFAIGEAVVLSGFSEPTYNGTFIVTDVTDPNEFGIAEINFVADDAGNANVSSLDSTDTIVFAEGNSGSPNSMTIAETSINGTLEVDGSGGVAVPIVDITPSGGDWIVDPSTQRFSVNGATGLVTYIGINPITVMIKYSLSAAPTSGPAQTLDLDLRINGVQQTKSIVNIISDTPPAPALYNGGNFSINPGDTFQLFKNNTTNTNNTDISAATLLINED